MKTKKFLDENINKNFSTYDSCVFPEARTSRTCVFPKKKLNNSKMIRFVYWFLYSTFFAFLFVQLTIFCFMC